MRSGRIPLFPLEVVLFPSRPLPLHIFEPRYKLMIGRCLANRNEFGVILARADGIAPVGCTAEIVEVVKKYVDGRMDILAIGRARYRLREVFDDQPYLEGEVEYLDEDPRQGTPETQQRLFALYEQCHALIRGRTPGPLERHAESPLTFQIASELPLDLDYKQELLETRTETERQSSLLERLNRWLPQLARLDRLRGRAGGNGHGLR